jgi:hypothetical protein
MVIRYLMSYKDTMNNMGWSMQVRITVLISVLLFAGCTGIGPPTVDRDRFDYVSAVSESWKLQTLLNLVKIRYLDAPVFMDVASVISQYALEGEIEMGFEWEDANTQTFGGRAMYTDRPTISYAPLMHHILKSRRPISKKAAFIRQTRKKAKQEWHFHPLSGCTAAILSRMTPLLQFRTATNGSLSMTGTCGQKEHFIF